MAKDKSMATAVFVAVIAGVVAVFAILGAQGRPPSMPAGPQHTLRFNLKGELIGVESEPPVDPVAASGQAGFVYDRKATEARVNATCLACHGQPGTDLSTHACVQLGRCVPPNHPPKTECIKCHRMAPAGGAPAAAGGAKP